MLSCSRPHMFPALTFHGAQIVWIKMCLSDKLCTETQPLEPLHYRLSAQTFILSAASLKRCQDSSCHCSVWLGLPVGSVENVLNSENLQIILFKHHNLSAQTVCEMIKILYVLFLAVGFPFQNRPHIISVNWPFHLPLLLGSQNIIRLQQGNQFLTHGT